MVQTQKTLKHKWCELGAHLFRPGAAAAHGAIAASTSMLFLRMLPPNEAWLFKLVFRAGVLTADFIWDSVTQVEMIRMRPTVS